MSAAKTPTSGFEPEEMDLVAIWLRADVSRWIAGLCAGIFAGMVAMAFAMLVATLGGMEFWFPVKLMATPILGSFATELGSHVGPIATGLIFFEVLCAFLGLVYAHFTGTNSLSALLGMGLVWGIFSWIFIWNLFLQSIKPIFAAQIPSGAVFPVCLVFGLSLTSVAFFHQAMGGYKR